MEEKMSRGKEMRLKEEYEEMKKGLCKCSILCNQHGWAILRDLLL